MEGSFPTFESPSKSALVTKPVICLKEAQTRYKTEICRNWVAGHCPYETNCLFAHGSGDLRDKIPQDNYKTKFCVNILSKGYCEYGARCQFKHSDNSPRKSCAPTSVRFSVFLRLANECE